MQILTKNKTKIVTIYFTSNTYIKNKWKFNLPVDASAAGEGQLEISINEGEVPNHVQVSRLASLYLLVICNFEWDPSFAFQTLNWIFLKFFFYYFIFNSYTELSEILECLLPN